MQSKNASVKESEIRRFVNNLVNIHTPLLDTWLDRDHVEVPGIPDDQQTDYVSHDSASGVQMIWFQFQKKKQHLSFKKVSTNSSLLYCTIR